MLHNLSAMAEGYSTRLITPTDRMFLRAMAYEAVAGEEEPPDEVLDNPAVVAFYANWGRIGDYGVIAEAEFEPVGAAWFRILDEDDPEGGFIAGETPELIIAVERHHRRRGVGGMLLEAVLERARQERSGTIGLNVPAERTDAVQTFKKHGFEVVAERQGILTMHCKL